MKKIITIAILLIAFASAGTIPQISNTPSTNVAVSEPVFYLDNNLNKLLINQIPETEETKILENNSVFETESFNAVDFYPTQFDFHFWVKAESSGDGFKVDVLNQDDEIICSTDEFLITSYIGQFREREFSCSTESNINSISKLKIRFTLNDNLDDLTIITGKEYTAGYSRIELKKQ